MASVTFTVAFDGAPMPRGLALALADARRNGWRGTVSSADRREGVAEKHGKMSQAALYAGWIARRLGFNPANPPGRSTHEYRSDGVPYRGPIGRPLAWWQLGLDVTESVQLVTILNRLGYSAFRPYSDPREAHHVNFRRSPYANLIRRHRWNPLDKRGRFHDWGDGKGKVHTRPKKIKLWDWNDGRGAVHTRPKKKRKRSKVKVSTKEAVKRPSELRLSSRGLTQIASHEGQRLTAYKPDSKEKYWTIGYGHYGPDVYQGMQITLDRARELLRQDASAAEATVRRLVKVDLNQDQYDALVSFVFNIGSGAFESSTLLRVLNRGNYRSAANQFQRWNKGASGTILKGLVLRRLSEANLFKGKI